MSNRRAYDYQWCEACAHQVKMITPEEAAAFSGVTPRTVYRWIEAEKLHFTETAEGLLMICIKSLN